MWKMDGCNIVRQMEASGGMKQYKHIYYSAVPQSSYLLVFVKKPRAEFCVFAEDMRLSYSA